jgi:hypothetical protein
LLVLEADGKWLIQIDVLVVKIERALGFALPQPLLPES